MRNAFITTSFKLLSAVALVWIPFSGSAAAQVTADDVVCSRCVGTSDIETNAITTGKIQNGAVNKNKILNGAVKSRHIGGAQVVTGKLANGAVTEAKLDSALQQRLDDLELLLDGLLNPPDCTTGTMEGAWQAYTIHSDELAERAGWNQCNITVEADGSISEGGCVNELGESAPIISGGFTTESNCQVSANLNFGAFGTSTISHATLDRTRNVLTGVGFGAGVGPLAVTAVRQ